MKNLKSFLVLMLLKHLFSLEVLCFYVFIGSTSHVTYLFTYHIQRQSIKVQLHITFIS